MQNLDVPQNAPQSTDQLVYNEVNRLYQARLSRLTFGISPASVSQAFFAWITQLALSPGHLMELAAYPLHHLEGLLREFSKSDGLLCAYDPRFRSDSWCKWPWRLYPEWFRFHEDFWKTATTKVSGLSPLDEHIISFMTRQFLDAVSPNNFIWTNPDLAQKTLESGGTNLMKGALNASEDFRRRLAGDPPVGMENFQIGGNLAATEGKVIFRNDLIELIQYAPQTADVYKEPILILPAWIMKYYILDLSPHNSLVKWLVSQGYTVFMVSWKNPDGHDRNKGMDTYVRDGALAAITIVADLMPEQKIHLTGYCLGGTLAMIVAAYMACEKDDRLKSLTLFAAQGDFTEAGEITLFINHSEVAFLKNMMWAKGYLDTKQMSGAFQMIRSNEMIWSRMVHEYLMGERNPLFDLTAWNADATRMPYKMHSEYLERLVLNNEFASGHYTVMGKPVSPDNITIPIFVVGTEKDHVAPWTSVYKIHFMTPSEVTFALTSGGHNAGIVSEPGHPRRYHYLDTKRIGDSYKSPDEWLNEAPKHDGSWWLSWESWLKQHNDPVMKKAAKNLGSPKYPPLGEAPGTYVHQR
jgi:polyhydroxyalkanoate synthase subunit PhaC